MNLDDQTADPETDLTFKKTGPDSTFITKTDPKPYFLQGYIYIFIYKLYFLVTLPVRYERQPGKRSGDNGANGRREWNNSLLIGPWL